MSDDNPEVLLELALIAQAASGNRQAQAKMAVICLAKEAGGVPATECAIGAEAFARLAAMHGHPEDMLLLSAVLHLRASHLIASGVKDRANILLGEVDSIFEAILGGADAEGREMLLSIMTSMADQGDELAALNVNWLMGMLSADEAASLTRAAKRQSENMAAATAGRAA